MAGLQSELVQKGMLSFLKFYKKGGVQILALKRELSLIFILTNPFQCYLWKCLMCMCLFCLFVQFLLSVLFVFHERNLLLLNRIIRSMTYTSE